MTSSDSAALLVGRSTSLPLWNVASARTRATRWGAFTARHRDCAASISLNAIARPAAGAGALGDLAPVPDGGEGRLGAMLETCGSADVSVSPVGSGGEDL